MCPKSLLTVQAWHKTVKGSSTVRGESSYDCRMWTEMVRMLRAVVDRSKHEWRRWEKLCRRRLTGVYSGRPVIMTMMNEDDMVRYNLLTGRVHQQGTAVLLHVSTCIQGQQAWSQFAPLPWTRCSYTSDAVSKQHTG